VFPSSLAEDVIFRELLEHFVSSKCVFVDLSACRFSDDQVASFATHFIVHPTCSTLKVPFYFYSQMYPYVAREIPRPLPKKQYRGDCTWVSLEETGFELERWQRFLSSFFSPDILLKLFLTDLSAGKRLSLCSKSLYAATCDLPDYYYFLVCQQYKLVNKITTQAFATQEQFERSTLKIPRGFGTWRAVVDGRFAGWYKCKRCGEEHRGQRLETPHTGVVKELKSDSLGLAISFWTCCHKREPAKACAICVLHIEPCFIDY